MTRFIHGNQHSLHPKKAQETARNSETSWLAGSWQKIQGSKQREIKNQVDEYKNLKKKKRRCSKEAIDWFSMWSNRKLLLKNLCHQKMRLHSACRWSWWSSYVPSTNKLVSKNHRANLSYSRKVSPEVSKLNHVVMNTNQGDQMQFSSDKRSRRKKVNSSLLSTHHSGRWIVLQNGVIDSSILQETFLSVWKCLSYNREKTLELRWDKKNGFT